MEETWNTFFSTGKINDYLEIYQSKEEREVEPDGTESHSDRDGLKCDADWRL